MARNYRSLATVLILALVSALFVVAPLPVAQAAGKLFTVTTTSDAFNEPDEVCAPTTNPDDENPPPCTLRQAMNAANEAANAGSTIQFLIPADDPGLYPPVAGSPPNRAWIITPTIALPKIEQDGTIIDGSTQTDRVGNFNNDGAEIIIVGTNVDDTGGLQVFSKNNTIKGIGLAGFRGTGAPGQLKGVGIEIASGSDGNKVFGNYIGLTVSAVGGTAILANADAGIIVYGNGNTIGSTNTTSTTEFNVISGNDGDGILINGGDTNIIAGNYIGTNGAISSAIPNKGNGINIRLGGNDNIIGNYTAANSAGFRNFISGNGAYGIQITDSKNNKIYGNFIGLDRFGSTKIPNALGGIRIDGTAANAATGNIIGAATPAVNMRNIIAGTGGVGITLNNFGVRLNKVVNNYIGVSFTNSVPISGTTQLSNGIVLSRGASDNTIGGTASERNVISNTDGDAILVSGFLIAGPPTSKLVARKNIIQGNYIGVAPNGTTPFSNKGSGIVLNTLVESTQIGGTSTQTNLIANSAGNGAVRGDGIRLTGSGVLSNTIGTNTVRTNRDNGIYLNAASSTLIAGASGAPFLVTANGLNGILASSTISTTITNGTMSSNGDDGIALASSTNGVTTVFSNTITTNSDNGLRITGSSNITATKNVISSNGQSGVRAEAGAKTVLVSGNTISGNTAAGVTVAGAAAGVGTQPVTILGNVITGNGPQPPNLVTNPHGFGIVFNPDGSGNQFPNHGIDSPFALRVTNSGRLTGRVLVTSPNSNADACLPIASCKLEIFTADPALLDGQGLKQLAVTPTIDAHGYFTATLGIAPPPAQLALTATDAAGNTSQFAIWTRAYGPLQIGPARSSPADPGQVITYTHAITNLGTVDYEDLQLSGISKYGWPFTLRPTGNIALGAGATTPVTLTLTLPTGSDPRVRAGNVELTRVTVKSSSIVTATASVTDTTTVNAKFILKVEPPTRIGIGVEGQPIDFQHMLTNVGNITNTVTLAGNTDIGWTTTITPNQVTLAPGQSIGVNIRAEVPAGTQAGTVGVTTVSATAAGIPQPVAWITDTTTVALNALATLVADQQADAVAGQTVRFRHTVTNLSNGEATFCLTGVSSLDSTLTYTSDQPGVTLDANNCFKVGKNPGTEVFNFFVDVGIKRTSQKGQTDLVTISLTTPDGTAVGGASVQDLLNIVRNFEYLVYLPVIFR